MKRPHIFRRNGKWLVIPGDQPGNRAHVKAYEFARWLETGWPLTTK